MTDNRRPEIDELISLVELPGPLPDGMEDVLWESTAELYEQLVERSATSPRDEGDATVIELAAGIPARERRPRRPRSAWAVLAAAAAAAVVAIVGGVLIARQLRGDGPSAPAGVPAEWAPRVVAANTALRASVTQADEQWVRTRDAGLSSLGDYLGAVSTAATVATGSLPDAPVELEPVATRYADSLSAWSAGAARLRVEIAADPELYLFDEELLRVELAEVRSLEEAALVTNCQPLRTALEPFVGPGDALECGAISTLGAPTEGDTP